MRPTLSASRSNSPVVRSFEAFASSSIPGSSAILRISLARLRQCSALCMDFGRQAGGSVGRANGRGVVDSLPRPQTAPYVPTYSLAAVTPLAILNMLLSGPTQASYCRSPPKPTIGIPKGPPSTGGPFFICPSIAGRFGPAPGTVQLYSALRQASGTIESSGGSLVWVQLQQLPDLVSCSSFWPLLFSGKVQSIEALSVLLL
jgi:hypothetical protein